MLQLVPTQWDAASMNIYAPSQHQSTYSQSAQDGFNKLHDRVSAIFDEVRSWEAWRYLRGGGSPPEAVSAFVREIYRSVCWYQPHTTEAAFHMIGRFPKSEVQLMKSLAFHKAEEAEHGLWAREDLDKLGVKDPGPSSPASFAVASVWWRLATTEDPLGYLGAEYLYEQLTALATKKALAVIEDKQISASEMRFVIEHATEDAKHSTFLKHIILDVLTRYPNSLASMLRCQGYFSHVWPLPVWEEAYQRCQIPYSANS